MQGSQSHLVLPKDLDDYSCTLAPKFETVNLSQVGSATYVGGTFSAKPIGVAVQSTGADTAFNLRMGTAISGANGTVAFQVNPKSQPYYLPICPDSLAPVECAAVAAAGTLNLQIMGYLP
jgi:hypothetical protein